MAGWLRGLDWDRLSNLSGRLADGALDGERDRCSPSRWAGGLTPNVRIWRKADIPSRSKITFSGPALALEAGFQDSFADDVPGHRALNIGAAGVGVYPPRPVGRAIQIRSPRERI